jgi:hypothetical protein
VGLEKFYSTPCYDCAMAANDASKREMFEHYALDRRAARIPNFRLEMLDDLTRYDPTGSDDEAILCFARLQPADAERRIGEELDRLRAHSWAAEWKVHDFDEPPDLKQRLEARGLACHHVEASWCCPSAMRLCDRLREGMRPSSRPRDRRSTRWPPCRKRSGNAASRGSRPGCAR